MNGKRKLLIAGAVVAGYAVLLALAVAGGWWLRGPNQSPAMVAPPAAPSAPEEPVRPQEELPPAPELKVRAFIGQEEVTGAAIAIDGIMQEAKTPAGFPVEKGQRYKVQVSLPGGRDGKNYVEFATRVAIERGGPQEVRATLKELILRVPADCRVAPGSITEPYTFTGWAKEIVHEKSGIEMVYIPAGSFIMGSPASETNRYIDETPHQVILSQGFYMGKFEVTQGQWEALMGKNPSKFIAAGKDAPVEMVSWVDCQEFYGKLGKGFRLPTEAEWEYACRAGTTTVFHYDNELDTFMANFDGNHPYINSEIGQYRETTVSVGQFRPNAWGLYDMHGNVREWCMDWYGNYPAGPVADPVGPRSGSMRVLRGGSWYCNAWRCRSAARGRVGAGVSYNDLGFRLVRTLP